MNYSYRAGNWLPDEKPMFGTLLNPSHPLSQGLVGCWLFNESGGNTVFDLSGHSNHGTLGGGTAGYCPAWTAGRTGPALDFDGDNDYVDCGNDESLDITDAITIELWHMPPVTPEFTHMVSKWQAYALRITSNNQIYMAIWDDGTEYKTTFSSGGIFQAGVWTHVVGTYNGEVVKAYINGVDLEKDNSHVGNIDTNSNILNIGRYQGRSAYVNGTIDEVRIYNRALSAEEIWQLYTDPFGMFYYPLEAELLYSATPPAGIVPQAMHHYEMLRV